MTFKHVKFEDSAIMRSLEKVAREKGMVKDEPMTKTASAQLDLTISSNLMENVLKLCAGLRANGFDKQANELEANYLAYKKANTLYETSKEKGEDLIHDAHPKGSHKLEGVLGDDLAVVETILDRHIKLIKIIDKKPTGKLSSSSSIINAVKTVLGQEVNPLDIIAEQQMKGRMAWSKINSEVDKNTSSWALQWSENYAWGTISQGINKMLNYKPQDMTIDRIENLDSRIREAYNFVNKMNNQDLLDRLQDLFKQMYLLYGPMKKARDAYNRGESAKSVENIVDKKTAPGPKSIPEVTVVGDPNNISSKVQNSLNKIKSYKSQIQSDMDLSVEEKNAANKWLDGRATLYNSQKAGFESIPEEEKANAAQRFLNNINKLDAQLEAFRSKWLG